MPVTAPVPSTAQYIKPADARPVALYFADARPADNKGSSFNNLFGMQMTSEGQPFDAISWMSAHIVKEMTARGLPVTLATAPGPDTVAITRVFVEARRVSGFSPYETFTNASADVVTAKGKQHIAAFVRRGKVPVWSFDEVVEPTFSAPLGLVAKEFSAKLGRILFDAKLSDAQVDALIAKTSVAVVDYRDVHELGFSNNTRAILQLVKLTASKVDEVTQAAYSALGVLRATEQFSLLTTQAENTKADWEDRATALKAIGDLGTPEARAYLDKTQSSIEKETSVEAMRTKTLIMNLI